MKAIDALKLAIDRESGASRFYREAAKLAVDPDAQRMFQWLSEEESRHLVRLNQQLMSMLESNIWLEWKRAIPPVERAEFPVPSEAVHLASFNADEASVIRQAIESEKEAIVFYTEAEESTPDLGGKSMFKLLCEEEEGHLTLLEGELEWITKYHKYFILRRFDYT
jgi:rubrerythrin